jgi:hypothetical protein
LLLLACALCRQAPLVCLRPANVAAIETVERHAEGLVPRREMKKACKHSDLGWLARETPAAAIRRALGVLFEQTPTQARGLAARAICEVVSNPFRPIELRHCWLRQNDGAAGHLAHTIAAEGRYNELPILADALEDTGCGEPVLLNHLRRPDGHLRGCWALDLLCRK